MAQSKTPEFHRVGTDEWRLADSVGPRRLDHLTDGPGYCEIIDQVAKSIVSLVYRREILKEDKRFSRLVATLSCASPIPVDLFHNSAAGYRAQYYIKPELGESANCYAAAKLAGIIAAKMRINRRRGYPLKWSDLSIHDSGAKVWIHQGRWLRAPDAKFKQLQVDRWRVLPTLTPEERKRARYSQLTPWIENRIDFKGVFVSRDGELFGTLKPNRAMHIHKHGFT